MLSISYFFIILTLKCHFYRIFRNNSIGKSIVDEVSYLCQLRSEAVSITSISADTSTEQVLSLFDEKYLFRGYLHSISSDIKATEILPLFTIYNGKTPRLRLWAIGNTAGLLHVERCLFYIPSFQFFFLLFRLRLLLVESWCNRCLEDISYFLEYLCWTSRISQSLYEERKLIDPVKMEFERQTNTSNRLQDTSNSSESTCCLLLTRKLRKYTALLEQSCHQ